MHKLTTLPPFPDRRGWRRPHRSRHPLRSVRFGQADPVGLRAIDSLRILRFGDGELSLRLVGLGRPEEFAGEPPLGPAAVWESATPFLVTRHLKRRGARKDPREWSHGPEGLAAFVRQVLREELQRRGLPEAEVETLERLGPRALRPVEFRLFRDRTGDDGSRRPRGLLRLRFAEPIPGPIALGHSSHFGLGLFVGAKVIS
jgi:CRISPR-associated protein Csb2